jgi:2-alkyl-3-oxoalkanoate reductase
MTRLAAVTGATGFLGRYIVRTLALAGWRMRILARRPLEHPELADLELETVCGDLSDRGALRALVEGADAVVHAAGLIKAPTAADFWAVNAAGTEHLASTIGEAKPPARVILLSSMAAREPHLSTYARTKRAGEERLMAVLGRRFEWVILRPCAIYGPWDKETLAIFRAVSRRIVPRPHAMRGRIALIHASDAAAAVAALAEGGPAGAILEITDERAEGYSWDEVIAAAETALAVRTLAIPLPGVAFLAAAAVNTAAARALRRTPMLTPGKVREMLHADWGSTADRQPSRDLWRPMIGLSRGFRDTVSWYRERHWLPPAATGWAGGNTLQ